MRTIFYVSLAFVLSGCVTMDGDFAKAQTAGTSQAYSDFITRYPHSDLLEKAQKGRDEALWREIKAANTPAGYFSFIKDHPPTDPRASEAREALRKLLVDGKGTAEENLEYMTRYPKDPSASDIRHNLEKSRYEALSTAEDPQAAALFVAQYPGTPEAVKLSAVVRKHDLKRAEKVGTRLAYQFFLKRHSSGPEAEKARALLANLSAVAIPAGDASDLGLIPKLRRANPILPRIECREGLTERLRREKDLFGSQADELRERLDKLSAAKGSLPDFCAGMSFVVPEAQSQDAANAVNALARLMERQQGLASLFSGPDQIAADAQEIGGRAAAMADDAESQELELEALYGAMPADPKRPDDTASKNAHEALRRAKHGYDVARGQGQKPKKAEAGEVLRKMDQQADLLVEIIASCEKLAAGEGKEASE